MPTTAILKPWSSGNRTAYDRALDLSDLPTAYKRCRRQQHFIASIEALAATPQVCPVCSQPVTDESNRGVYDPRSKRFVVMHYDCSWQALLTAIFALRAS